MKASLKYRSRNFLFGLTAVLLGIFGAYLVYASRLTTRVGTSQIPPGVGLFLPGSILLVLGGVVVMTESLKPIEHGPKFCLVCNLKTNHFKADARFRNGKKLGDSYICDNCGQKYLVPNTADSSSNDVQEQTLPR